jgi:hypothetical protein
MITILRKPVPVTVVSLGLLTLTLQVGYIFGAASYPNPYFGISQFHILPQAAPYLLLPTSWLAALGVAWAIKRNSSLLVATPRSRKVFHVSALLASIAAVALFLSLRNQFINRDGQNLTWKIPQGVSASGAHVTHDQMLELFVHSRFWYYTNQMFGLSVRQSYQVLSSLAGGAFIFTLLLLLAVLKPRSRTAYLLLFLSGGFMQLFFGDVENYTLVSVLILAYILAAQLHIQGRLSIAIPSLLLSLAISFHLLAGWLLPSLAYLYVRLLKKRHYRQVVFASLAFAGLILAVLLFFHFHGLPIATLLTESHVSGMGGHYDRYINALDPEYFTQLGNLVLLLYPGTLLLLPAALLAARSPTTFNGFLAACVAGTVAFILVWKAQLGVLQDWNLFAPALIPLGVFVSNNLGNLGERGVVPAVAFGLSAGAHSLSWIVSNHLVNP